MKFDENLASVHAYLCGDGYLIKNPKTQNKKYYMIGFRNTNLVLLEDFQKRFHTFFGKKPYITNEGRCRIGSKEIYEKLTDSFGSFYSYHWSFPELDIDLSRIWLRAFFDCEGWVVCKSHQSRGIGLESVNENGINQIKKALNKLNISCKVKKRSDKRIFLLGIYGKENLIQFRNKINFLHPSKKGKLNEVVHDFMDYYWDFPSREDELKRFIRKLLKDKLRIRKDNGVLRLISNKKENLILLQKELNRLFYVESKINTRRNGVGTVYFEFGVNKKKEIEKLIKQNFLSDEVKKKWLNLKR